MKCAAVFLVLLPVALMAQETTSIDTHTHGVGHMAISFTETEFALALEVPGNDIVGFEHAAENEDERARVADAISDLSKPLGLFEVPPEAGCVTASANVALVGDAFGQEGGDTGTSTADHNEFHADYLVQCQDMALVTSIRFAYFERFTDAQRLQVDLTSAGEARTYTVERQAPLLTVQN